MVKLTNSVGTITASTAAKSKWGSLVIKFQKISVYTKIMAARIKAINEDNNASLRRSDLLLEIRE